MKRHISGYLQAWKDADSRKVLLLRGARQVGKTWCVRELGKSFAHFAEINFEQDPALARMFSGKLDAALIAQRLGAYVGVPVIPGKTLLFLDEIQACPEALRGLRFFSEQLPALHVVAAGSLLEFALAELPSFGVGRIESLYLYPLSFREFVAAQGLEGLLGEIDQASMQAPLPEALHARLTELVRDFQLIGGYPEVVNHFIGTQDYLGCFKRLDDLLTSLTDDFAKYRKRISPAVLGDVLRSVAAQSGEKFKYSKVSADLSGARGKEALELLIMAGLAHKVVHADAQGLPLGAQTTQSRFKVILTDIGLLQRLSGMSAGEWLSMPPERLVHNGAVAEVFVGTELVKYAPPGLRPQLYYWHRESRNSNAEIDYVLETVAGVVPVEVKAGRRGQMQSLRVFCENHVIPHAVRLSLENFSGYQNVRVVPLYAVNAAMS